MDEGNRIHVRQGRKDVSRVFAVSRPCFAGVFLGC